MNNKIAPRPWRIAESMGGKTFIYDANNQVLFVPNMSVTGKTTVELTAIYQIIVQAVNSEFNAWKMLDGVKATE